MNAIIYVIHLWYNTYNSNTNFSNCSESAYGKVVINITYHLLKLAPLPTGCASTFLNPAGVPVRKRLLWRSRENMTRAVSATSQLLSFSLCNSSNRGHPFEAWFLTYYEVTVTNLCTNQRRRKNYVICPVILLLLISLVKLIICGGEPSDVGRSAVLSSQN